MSGIRMRFDMLNQASFSIKAINIPTLVIYSASINWSTHLLNAQAHYFYTNLRLLLAV